MRDSGIGFGGDVIGRAACRGCCRRLQRAFWLSSRQWRVEGATARRRLAGGETTEWWRGNATRTDDCVCEVAVAGIMTWCGGDARRRWVGDGAYVGVSRCSDDVATLRLEALAGEKEIDSEGDDMYRVSLAV